MGSNVFWEFLAQETNVAQCVTSHMVSAVTVLHILHILHYAEIISWSYWRYYYYGHAIAEELRYDCGYIIYNNEFSLRLSQIKY